jgi:GNAT superfamily N-acetyltransferase
MLRLNEAAYQMPLGEPGSLPMEQPGWWAPPRSLLTVVESEGRPASCAAVLQVNGLRYVALVATHPEFQRRGLADRAMRDVLHRSLAHGISTRTYLHATDAGRPVYERMGYQPTAVYTVFGPQH